MQLCKKHCSSRKLHPNPSVPIRPHTKTKLHTKPRSISNSPRKMMKKMPTKKINLNKKNFQENFSLFLAEGSSPRPPPRVYTSPPVGRPSSSARIRFARRPRTTVHLCIVAGSSVQIVRITSKIRQKLGFKKFSVFFRLKPDPGHGLS